MKIRELLENINSNPTTNSDGKPIHPTSEGIKNFWQWFNGSKVVDDQGRPITLYHGTVGDFSIFDIEKTSYGSRFGPGHYFTKDKKTMAAYSGKENSKLMPVYVKMINPMPEHLSVNQINNFMGALTSTKFSNGYDATEDHKRIHKALLTNPDYARETLLSNAHFFSKADWQRGMNAAGFDGIIEEVFRELEYVVINSNQIKSAIGNQGDYSHEDDIVKENNK